MIEMKEVRKTYDAFQFAMSMEIPGGRITGLVGKNGAGKSTAIRLILGLTEAESGEIAIFGKEIHQLTMAEKAQIGASLAESGFSSYLNIADVKKILEKMYPNFDKGYFEKMCRELRLPEKKRIREYSTGMRAKLRVLTALSHHAKLLIMDEPTAGLDVEARNHILDMLRTYMAEDDERSILITSHIASDLEQLCDDIYLIHNGSLILHEDTDVILEQYGVLKVSEDQFAGLEQDYLLKTQKMSYGYACFTNHKDYYQENYPGIIVENGNIDELILMMTGGYQG
ncbi:ABC transporter ATP-binding protein [uncultured Eubacterium sp.]|uniref:ABC transporter ATP-binding protein n=1 Tax=uncultured Eubacterium sp. TaxID=165185 RepID=UPI0025CBFBB4|nr:ABC transporter ATP-binding protein [uncultured Eubacterium sp.]